MNVLRKQYQRKLCIFTCVSKFEKTDRVEIKELFTPAPGVTVAVRHLLIGFSSLCITIEPVPQVTYTVRRERNVQGEIGERAIDKWSC